jgi:PhnB protein
MLTNRSAPHTQVVPVLIVANVRAAVLWYARVFGFVEHVQTRDGRSVQLGLAGGGDLLVGEVRPRANVPSDGRSAAILLEVEDAQASLARVVDNYGTVVFELQDTEAGERQAMIDDVFGNRWLLGQRSTSRSEPRASVVSLLGCECARSGCVVRARVRLCRPSSHPCCSVCATPP